MGAAWARHAMCELAFFFTFYHRDGTLDRRNRIVIQSNYDNDDIKLIMNSKFLNNDDVCTLINVQKSKHFGLEPEADKTHIC